MDDQYSVASTASASTGRGYTRAAHQHRHRKRWRSHGLDFFLQQWSKCLHPAQMDFDNALTTFRDLALRRTDKVYMASQNRNEIKGHYARDDPAFTLLVLFVNFLLAIAYRFVSHGIFFNPLAFLVLFIQSTLVFTGLGCALATLAFFVTNRALAHERRSSSIVEWFYCWDVHCNAVIVPLLLLGLGQLLLLPLLLRGGVLPTLCSNTLYLVASWEYVRASALGFIHLSPSHVNRDNLLAVLYSPAFAAVLLWFLLSAFNINCTHHFMLL